MHVSAEFSENDSGREAGSEITVLSGRSIGSGADEIVLRWVDAFNARDLEGMLACLAEDVDFHPLRFSGVSRSFQGRDGVRDWFAQFRRLGHAYQIVVSQTADGGNGRLFASGSLSLDGVSGVGPVSMLHRVDGGLIVDAHHYLSDPHLIQSLGLIP